MMTRYALGEPNDTEMINHAGIGVSYYGKTALNKVADIHFNNTIY